MIKVSVLYPNNKGSRFDMNYYCKTHIPLVERKLGSALKGVSVEDQLKEADVTAIDMASCNFIIVGSAYFIAKAKLFNLFFCVAAS